MTATDDAIELQLHRVRLAIERTFTGLIDVSNCAPARPEAALRTRGLAALAIQYLTAADSKAAAECIVDGFGDNGIDGVYVNEAAGRLLLVQSKWSDKPQQTISLGDTLKFTKGVRDLIDERYDRFNEKLKLLVSRISSVVNQFGACAELVIVTTSVRQLSDVVLQELEGECRRYNNSSADGPMRVTVLGLEEVHTHVLNTEAHAPIDLTVTIQNWGSWDAPFPSIYGTIPAGQIADWHHMHRERLFDRNIRRALGPTKVNQRLVDTLLHEPEHFWYFNNGITVLCDRIERALAHSADRDVAELKLHGVSVVNGAQTVASVAEAAFRSIESLKDAFVPIRIVSLERGPKSFAIDVTRANNLQNAVTAADFTALDEHQDKLRRDFAVTLHKTYAFRRGEPTPFPEDGCTVGEAALALACAHPDVRFAVLAHGNPGQLTAFESPRYEELFYRDLDAIVLWRQVLAARRVGQLVAATVKGSSGRRRVVAKQCRELVTHIVMGKLRHEVIKRPFADWDAELDRIGTLAPQVLASIFEHVERDFAGDYVSSLFKNTGKCQVLADAVGRDLDEGRIPAFSPTVVEVAPARDGLAFQLFRNGIEAYGRIAGNGFVAEAGSTAVATPVPSLAQHQRSAHSRREWLIREGILRPAQGAANLLVLVQDHYFDSPTQAADVLLGRAVNGRTAWCTADGRTLNRAQAEQRSQANDRQ